jgi:hypothetical protein
MSDLPTEYYELQTKSMISLWHIEEENKVQFRLQGLNLKSSNTNSKADLNLEEMVDKLALLNFLYIFLSPTTLRLRELKKS